MIFWHESSATKPGGTTRDGRAHEPGAANIPAMPVAGAAPLVVSQVPERVRKSARLAVKHPRWEPYAGKLHVRFWCSEVSCHSSGCKSRQHKESSPCCSDTQRQGG